MAMEAGFWHYREAAIASNQFYPHDGGDEGSEQPSLDEIMLSAFVRASAALNESINPFPHAPLMLLLELMPQSAGGVSAAANQASAQEIVVRGQLR